MLREGLLERQQLQGYTLAEEISHLGPQASFEPAACDQSWSEPWQDGALGSHFELSQGLLPRCSKPSRRLGLQVSSR